MKTITAISKHATALSLDELIIRYKTSNEADGKSPKTVKWYDDMLKSFRTYLSMKGCGNDMSYFNLENVRHYVLHLREKNKFAGHPYTPEQNSPLSPRTVQCHVRVLRAFASWLYAEGYTSENRLKHLKLPKAPVKVIKPLSQEEIRKVIASVNKNSPTGIRNHAILVTLLDTGLRASEAASITLTHLNLKGGHVKIMGKGGKERVVPIGKYVQMTLWSYIDKVRPNPTTADHNNLFLSRAGKPINVNTIKLVFSRLAKGSGIERLHAHMCRHTFAINYLLAGGDIFSLREILGHTTLDMVNHYLHFTSAQITAQHHKYSPMDRLQDAAEDDNNNMKLLQLS